MSQEHTNKLVERLVQSAAPYARVGSNIRLWLSQNADLRKEAATALVAQEAEIAALRMALDAVVLAYDHNNPMRTADFHKPDCSCMRCAVDSARALTRKEG